MALPSRILPWKCSGSLNRILRAPFLHTLINITPILCFAPVPFQSQVSTDGSSVCFAWIFIWKCHFLNFCRSCFRHRIFLLYLRLLPKHFQIILMTWYFLRFSKQRKLCFMIPPFLPQIKTRKSFSVCISREFSSWRMPWSLFPTSWTFPKIPFICTFGTSSFLLRRNRCHDKRGSA